MTRPAMYGVLAGLLLGGPAIAAPTAKSEAEDLSRVDVRGTTASIVEIASTIDALAPERRAEAVASLAFLVANDPYTRAAIQVPATLHSVVASIPSERLDPFVRNDWETLQEGLAVHVALLASLGADVKAPLGVDVMAGVIAKLPVQAERLDASMLAQIAQHSDRMETATNVIRPCPRGPWAIAPGQPWTLGMQLGGWHDALRRIEPFVTDPDVHAQVTGLIQVLDAYGTEALR